MNFSLGFRCTGPSYKAKGRRKYNRKSVITQKLFLWLICAELSTNNTGGYQVSPQINFANTESATCILYKCVFYAKTYVRLLNVQYTYFEAYRLQCSPQEPTRVHCRGHGGNAHPGFQGNIQHKHPWGQIPRRTFVIFTATSRDREL